MANTTDQMQPKHMTFSKSKVPAIGCLIDYFDIGLHYLCKTRSLTESEKLRACDARASLTPTFLALICFLLGFIANVKLEVVTFDESPLSYDLHFMLMSKRENIYIDNIDPSRVIWYIEASDCAALLISCLLIWSSSYVRSPLSEYVFLPWMGVILRGLFLRQLPTVTALVYTMAVVDGQHVKWLFLTGFSFLFVLQTRISLEITRAVRSRWEQRASSCERRVQVETLWSSEEDDGDVPSVEMRNFVY